MNQTVAGVASIAPEFVIGLTGHRDVAAADREAVRAALTDLLKDIARRFSYVPVRLATGLAEGADTLATEVALELDLGVNAILPAPQAIYEADFEGAALDRFRSLVADDRVRVSEMPLAEGTDAAAMSDQSARDEQYAMLGSYLARRSNILIAIWDGEDTGLKGGTSEVILRFLADDREVRPNPVERGDVVNEGCGNLLFWLPVRRGEAQGVFDCTPRLLVSNANYDCYWEEDRIPEQIVNRMSGFDDYGAERMSALGADLPAWALGGDDAGGSPDLSGLDAEYIRADQLARAYQRHSDRMFALFGLLAAGMGLAFLIYAKLLASPVFLWIYVVLFAGGFLGFRHTASRHYHSKHLAYRSLAETFRVQYFLILSGAGGSYNLRRILGLTSVDQFKRFEWLQEAIRCAEPLVYFGHNPARDTLGLVRERWIEDQKKYYEKKLHKLHASHQRLETIKTLLLVGSVIGALALIFFKKTLLHLDMIGYDGKAWLVFFMGLLPLWAAVWELYQGKMAIRELLWQYTNQLRLFRAASRDIAQSASLEDGQKIIRDLGDKALIEIYLWSVHRYHREHEPPAAG